MCRENTLKALSSLCFPLLLLQLQELVVKNHPFIFIRKRQRLLCTTLLSGVTEVLCKGYEEGWGENAFRRSLFSEESDLNHLFSGVGCIPMCAREQWTEVSSEGIQSHTNTDGDCSCHWKPVFTLSAMYPQTSLLVITVLDRVSHAKATLYCSTRPQHNLQHWDYPRNSYIENSSTTMAVFRKAELHYPVSLRSVGMLLSITQ